MLDKNLFFCRSKHCQEVLDVRNAEDGYIKCTKCSKIFCKNCKRGNHSGITCKEAEKKAGIVVDLQSVHYCPQCNSMFEHIGLLNMMDKSGSRKAEQQRAAAPR